VRTHIRGQFRGISSNRREQSKENNVTGRLEGKVAFVTGAARGQGRSHAVRLAQEGADIIAIDLCEDVDSVPFPLATPEDLEQTVKEVEALGRRIVASRADVRDFSAVQEALSRGVDTFGQLDVVCANAGVVSYGMSHEIDAETWRDVIDINLTGVWHTAKAAVPILLEAARGGSMVFTASAAGLGGMETIAHYTASKHGVVGLMKSMALELAPHGIRVNCVCPSSVNTPMTQNQATFDLLARDIPNATPEQVKERFASVHPMGFSWVEAVDVSNAVLFLASDEARYISGVAVPIDGAMLAR
jgi:(+)-trans-carveol dehydrogenase